MRLDELDSVFLNYLITEQIQPGDKLPTLAEISDDLDISVGKLREQFEHARALGLVSTKPRVGSRREPFNFATVVTPGILFALASDEVSFEQISELRRSIETGFWDDAVTKLEPEDICKLQTLVASAQRKLSGTENGIQIPHSEHRQLHLTVFGRIDNPLILGLLTAYWDVYDASELTRYQSYAHWQEVWRYHERIVQALATGRFEEGRTILIEHFNLLSTTPASIEANSR